jgi:hypothetical protein
MDLLESFGYAPSMASMALLTSINPNPEPISDNQHSQTTGGMEVRYEWRLPVRIGGE